MTRKARAHVRHVRLCGFSTHGDSAVTVGTLRFASKVILVTEHYATFWVRRRLWIVRIAVTNSAILFSLDVMTIRANIHRREIPILRTVTLFDIAMAIDTL
jgi:hypothetical protein